MEALFDQGRAAPCPEDFNMAAYVLGRCDALETKVALSIIGDAGSEDWTYGQLKAAILGCATGLLQAGLAPGDRLLMRLGNTVDFPICYMAAIWTGIVPVPTSAQLTNREVTAIASVLKPKLIVAEPGIALPTTTGRPVLFTNEFRAMRSLPPAPVQRGDANRPAYIIFTSGTGGKPRGVVHAHRAVWARRMMWQGWYGITAQDRMFHAGAFNWTYTLGTGLMDPWTIGATALIPAPTVNPTEIPALLASEKATIFAAAPGVFRQMLRAPLPEMPNLRHALSAGEKMPDRTRSLWQGQAGTPVHEAYGLSECSTFISSCPDHPAPDGVAGFPQPGRRVAIHTGTGIAQVGEPGIIAINRQDAGLMLEYLNDPAETAARMRNGWFLTGDMGAMDETGAITYLGRDDDMMNAGGFRVSPVEVENAMGTCPGVMDCAAVEVKIKSDASVIALFYVSKQSLPDQALRDHAEQVLARYKQPRLFHHIDKLPRGANGKVLRRNLRRLPQMKE